MKAKAIGMSALIALTPLTLDSLAPPQLQAEPLSSCCVIPGDADHSGSMNIADITFLIARTFTPGADAPFCCDEADVNADGRVNLLDMVLLVERIFAGGTAPVCGSGVGQC
ncbi:MAG: hypothetical protein IH914_11535 [candidate division Zixibacteria bacterium]|nr:hypothetical protein [candidate division Zixibacteria bacterium]